LMDFIEIALIDLNGEAAETVGELFNRYGYGGAVMESYPPTFDKVTVRTVIPSEDDHRLREIELMLALIGQALPGGLPEARLQFVGKSDWAEAWKTHFHPVRVGRRFVIKPSWRDYEPAAADLLIEIDPGLAFGSGLHPTTQLCLNILEDLSLAGQTLFDVGTGSGILALAALKLGAASIRAVDVDDIAVRVACENFERNGYPLPIEGEEAQTEAAVGSAADTGGRQWDIVVANILANTIIELLPDLKAALSPGGKLILSGIIAEQEADVTAAAISHTLHLSDRRIEEDWVALVFQPG
jgi:ribosomal protein L11 methyltransferase